MASTSSTIPDPVNRLTGTEAENENVKGSDNAEMSNQQTMADSSQLPVYQQISESIIPNILGRLTEAKNFLLKNVDGHDNANMLDNLEKLIAELKEIQELLRKNFAGHDDTAGRGALVKTVLESIFHGLSIINLKTDGDDGKEVALRAVQLEAEFDKLEAELNKLNGIVSKLKLQLQVDSVFTPYPTVSKIYEVIIPAVVAHLQDLANKFSLGGDDQSTSVQVQKLTIDLRDIRSYVKKLEDNPDSRNKLKNIVLALLRYSFFDDSLIAPQAQAKQIQARLRVLNNVLNKLKHQISPPNKLALTDFDDHWYDEVNREFDYSQLHIYQQISGYIIPNLLHRLTEVENCLRKNVKGNDNANTLENLKKLIAGLKEIQEFLKKNFAGHDDTAGGGALVKTVLESILHRLSIINLETDGAVQLIKANFDKPNEIVSKLKLQLPVDLAFTPYPRVSKIDEIIIPAVVARLELANMFSLWDDDQSTGVQVQKLTNDLSDIRSYVKKLEDNPDSQNKLKNIVLALLQYSFFHDLVTAPEAQAKQFQAKLRVLNNVLIKLKDQISSPNKLSLTDFDDHWYDEVNRQFEFSQLPVHQQISKSIIPNILRRLTEAENFLLKNVKGLDNANMLDNLKKYLIAGLKEIQKFLENNPAGHDTTAGRGALAKTDLERILHGLSIINLETDGNNGEEVALRAVQLEAEFDELNGIVSKLKLQLLVYQEIRESIIPNLLGRLTEAENFLVKNVKGQDNANMLDNLKKLIAGLKEIQELLTNNFAGHDDNAGGALVKTVLERILHELSIINLDIDKLKAELDKLNGIVSKLKLQLRVDFELTPCLKVSKIYEIIIPAVLARLELANMFSLWNDDQSTGVQVKKLTNDLSNIESYVKKLEDNPDSWNKLKNIVYALLRYSFFDDLVIAPKAQAKQFQARLLVLNYVLINLNDHISSPNKLPLKHFDEDWYSQLNREFDYSQLVVYQEIRESIIPKLLRRLTEAENFIVKNVKGHDNANMLDNLKKLITGLKERREFLRKNFTGVEDTAGRGALAKADLERILHGLSIIDLETDGDDGKEVQLKAEFDKLNEIVSNLKLQLQVDSVFTPYPTVSKIYEVIIPAVVARLQQLGDKSTGAQVQKLTNDLGYIRSYVKKLEDNLDSWNKLKNIVHALLRYSYFDDSVTAPKAQPKQFQARLRVLNNVLIKVKHQISSPNKLPLTDFDDHWFDEVNREFDYSQVLEIFPVLHVDEDFKNDSAFRNFREVYESLNVRTKLCLLCFAIIPENEVVKKRFMTHWWVGEGFVAAEEAAADRIFRELAKKDCIEPVDEKFRFAVDSYRMNPFIRSAVSVLAKEAGFFDFDDKKGYPTANFESFRACLVDGISQQLFKTKKIDQSKRKTDQLNRSPAGLDPEKLQVIFNVNEPYPDVFELEWFSKLKNVKVLYLGRWQTSAKHHIEVEGTEFLEGLKTMKLLRFLSLQGISRITELPRSVCQLPNLGILDLRGCHNLESLPDRIGSLRTLTHLDISECYLLDSMPKGIANLSQLQVLKGFVMSDRDSRPNICTLDHLSRLVNLRKLSIYTNKKTFPDDASSEVTTLHKLKALQKLTITWGAGAFPPKPASTTSTSNKVADNKTQDVGVDQTTTPKINSGGNKNQDKNETQAMTTNTETTKPFKKLKKLDLKCYPCTTAPSLLWPGKLPELEKLYIRGGNLQNLSTPVQENNKWPKVKVLRLKFLSDLKMDWKKLLSSFPDLIYLENFKCPKLTYFPCNENGVVWLRAMN